MKRKKEKENGKRRKRMESTESWDDIYKIRKSMGQYRLSKRLRKKNSAFNVMRYFASSDYDCVYARLLYIQNIGKYRSDTFSLRQERDVIFPETCVREKAKRNFLNITLLQLRRLLLSYSLLYSLFIFISITSSLCIYYF